MMRAMNEDLHEQKKAKRVRTNKYFIEDEPKLESQFDQEQRKKDLKDQRREEFNFNQIDDDEPERSSDDEFEGALTRPKTAFLDLPQAKHGTRH